MTLSKVTHVVLYRPYRALANSPREYCLFNDGREAQSFSGSHSRYCSSMDTCRVDCILTQEILTLLINA